MKIQKITQSVITFILGFCIVSCSSSTLKDGIYEGRGEGRSGEIIINLDISEGKVTSGQIISENESDFAKPSINLMIDRMIETQDLKSLDAVSGATLTCQGTIEAITNAINLSKGIYLKKAHYKNTKCDVVVIGSGNAGLMAAYEASRLGADVIVLEKMGIIGGNSNCSTAGINAAESSVQRRLGIEDSKKIYFEDTMKGGYYKNDENLVKFMVNNSSDAVDYLISLGADLSDVGKMAGSTNKRTHRPKGGLAIGEHLVGVLSSVCKRSGIEIRTRNKVLEILDEDGKVSGVHVQSEGYEYTIKAPCVIIATGGFGANNDMVSLYRPDLKGYATTNHAGATGDGIILASKFSAQVIGMNLIQTHPTVVKGSGIMLTEAIRGNGAILVNHEGNRFVNEMLTRDVVSEKVLNQSGGSAFIIFDEDVRRSLKAIESYISQGLLVQGKSINELAVSIGVDQETLRNTIITYNQYQDSGVDKSFGRKASEMPRGLRTGPYYACEIVPAIHHTMGGLKINVDCEVLNTNGKVIPGLYACGEVTGGIQGGNRLGGNAVTDIIVFGRKAGQSAFEYINK